jgi:hypothetical protein
MKIQEIKSQVYKLAGVRSTAELKTKEPFVKEYNLRLKKSWREILQVIQDWEHSESPDPAQLEDKELVKEMERCIEQLQSKFTEHQLYNEHYKVTRLHNVISTYNYNLALRRNRVAGCLNA